MLAALLAALLFAPTQPPPVTCDEVRRVRGLAVADGLDTEELAALEGRVCARPPQGEVPAEHAASGECTDLRVMSTLAHAAGNAAGVDEVDDLKNLACSTGLPAAPTFTWSDGVTARYADGGWNWPSGVTARYADGSWTWPNGVTARYADGTWNWPSGVLALDSDGGLHQPNGVATTEQDLLTPVCGDDPERCRQLEREAVIAPDLEMAELLALVWTSR